jgi:lipopolysaccharide biosynthesis glycosyltransferase
LLADVNVRFLRSEDIPQFARPREPHQATDFTYTRFLVPFLCDYKGIAVFCDCDFLFRTDISEAAWGMRSDCAVKVVKHPQYIPLSHTKMDNIPQHPMHRKNWASLIVFNNEHPACKRLTPEYVNTVTPGRKLHTFDWVDDSCIGSLSLDWNTLDGYYELDNPRAIHYTEGGPWFDKYKHTYYSEYWWKEYDDYINISGQQRTLSPNT